MFNFQALDIKYLKLNYFEQNNLQFFVTLSKFELQTLIKKIVTKHFFLNYH